MKNMLLITGAALALGMQPALAEDMKAGKTEDANQAETMHAPTNRVGDQVPTMTSAENKDASAMDKTSGENKAETMHAPTNRVGDQVPTMKSAENDKKKSSAQ